MPDDAAVYRLNDEQALIVTTDFFTPIVDDAYDYGAIAAANALSDVYAMGGRPVLALNIAAFPADLPASLLTNIMRGAADKVRESGAVIAGGHTIKDKEPKVGLAVVGLAHPQKLLTKAQARPGDMLVLTKPLGTGTIATAAKNDQAEARHVEAAVGWMSRLNRAAAEAAVSVEAHAATDITGFGLLGHATEMADLSGVTLEFHLDGMPFMDGARQYADAWIFPGGSADNKQTYEGGVRFAEGLSSEEQMLLFDAQTSGGLLIAVPAEQFAAFTAVMKAADAPCWQIGSVIPRRDVGILVTQ
jgi:selenide,water dikinase